MYTGNLMKDISNKMIESLMKLSFFNRNLIGLEIISFSILGYLVLVLFLTSRHILIYFTFYISRYIYTLFIPSCFNELQYLHIYSPGGACFIHGTLLKRNGSLYYTDRATLHHKAPQRTA